MERKITLAEYSQELLGEWDWEKNDNIDPYKILHKSNKKAWWICKKDGRHNWNASILNRANGQGCSYCSGKKVLMEESLAFLHEDLMKEWDDSKNIGINPFGLLPKSGKKVWWVCRVNNKHKWETNVRHRTQDHYGCPFCSKQKVTAEDSFAFLHEELMCEWDWSKNTEVNPYKIAPKSNQKVWWVCKKNEKHEWCVSVIKRTDRNTGCPFCYGRRVLQEDSFGMLHNHLLLEWDWNKNKDINPYELAPKSGKRAWWICNNDNNHRWSTVIRNRANGKGCPQCCESKGEKQISQYLYKHEILHEPQKEFEGLVGLKGGNLSYDFYLPRHTLLIEFQGEQHEQFTRGLHKTKKDFEKQQEHDKRKCDFAKQNGIQLLEIWHWQFKEIDKILDEYLNNIQQKYNEIGGLGNGL